MVNGINRNGWRSSLAVVGHGWRAGVLAALAALAPLVSAAAPAAPANPDRLAAASNCHLPGHDMPLRCFVIDVPKDYAQPGKGTLKLHVAVAPAFREGARPDPLFVLAGGPGQAGSIMAILLDSTFNHARATRDIVLIDQRGTGKSGKLGCPELDRTDVIDPDQQDQMLAACLRGMQVDFNDYSTEAAARDLEQVRLALNARQVNVWGASYGTRLAQAYARLYPQSVRSMVIDGVASPQQNIGLMSRNTGRAMALLRQQCEQDAQCRTTFPQFAAQLDALIARSAKGNEIIHFINPLNGKAQQLPFRLDGFGEMVRSMLYAPHQAVRLPWLVMQAHDGNWQPFMAQAFSGGEMGQSMAIGLELAVLCSEDVPYMSPDQIQAERGLSFIGDSWSKRLQRYCAVIHVKPHPRQDNRVIQTPTLLLSGVRDPVTPPESAEEAMRTLPNSQHLQAPQLGHNVSMFGCAPKLLRQFLDAPEQKLDGKCLAELPASPFVMSAAGAQP